MSGQGHQTFVDELARCAAEAADARWPAIAGRVAAPLRVTVSGRRGVGRRTVAHALAGAGIDVTASPAAADVAVHVIAEVAKPEDYDAIAACRLPLLTVLNKADLADRPTGLTAEPMVALLAAAVVDDTCWAALRVLAARPAATGTPDSFLADANPLPVQIRRRLLDTFDLYGLSRAVAAVRGGQSRAQVQALLRRLSRIDAVVAKITAAGAQVHYRRILHAVAELEALAVTDRRAAAFLSRDATVLAQMAAATAVVEAAGRPVERCGKPAALLRRAAHWQQYSRGPVSAVHRACATDIVRGSLRLWSPQITRGAR